MNMRLALLAGLTALAAMAFEAVPDLVTPASAQQSAQVQRQARPPRARPQIRVTPRYPYRAFHSPYPLPYDVEYPGPNAKRYCNAHYVREARPSGTVIVPRMQCWWGRG